MDFDAGRRSARAVRTARRSLAVVGVFLTIMSAVGVSAIGSDRARADPDALWTIVRQCVPDQQLHGNPAPCELVDLAGGEDRGYVVLKDIRGARQFLLIPTTPITGIESPAILDPGATNYFGAAWRARSFVEERAGYRLPRSWVSLAVNSRHGRSQNVLHIHIDCIRADVHQALMLHGPRIGPAWAPFPALLAGHRYDAIAIAGENLDASNPFTVLADGLPGAHADMGRQTLVVVGTVGAGGQPGFIILASRADAAAGNSGSGEELQDHDSCPAPAPEAFLTK